VADGQAQPATRETLAALRKELNGLVRAWHHRSGQPHAVIHAELRRTCGGPPLPQATAAQIRARIGGKGTGLKVPVIPATPGATMMPGSTTPAVDLWLCVNTEGVMTLPLAGQHGHGRTAFLRRKPVRIVDGRREGGYTNLFELICPSCGDHPYLDYSEVSPRLQRIRGPYWMEAGLAAYDEHLGALPPPHGGRARSSDPAGSSSPR